MADSLFIMCIFCFGKPVWHKGNTILVMDNLGFWIVSAKNRDLCKRQGSVYFKTTSAYLNTKLPTIGQILWSYIDDDLVIEDKLFQVTDACNSNRQPNRIQFNPNIGSATVEQVTVLWA